MRDFRTRTILKVNHEAAPMSLIQGIYDKANSVVRNVRVGSADANNAVPIVVETVPSTGTGATTVTPTVTTHTNGTPASPLAAGALWVDARMDGGAGTIGGVPIADGESYSFPAVAGAKLPALTITVAAGTMTVVAGRAS